MLIRLRKPPWISDGYGPLKLLRVLYLIELLFDGLPKLEVIDIAQDEDRLDNLAEGLQRSVKGMLLRVGVESPE